MSANCFPETIKKKKKKKKLLSFQPKKSKLPSRLLLESDVCVFPPFNYFFFCCVLNLPLRKSVDSLVMGEGKGGGGKQKIFELQSVFFLFTFRGYLK